MKYIQNTESDIKKMLDEIGVGKFEDLLSMIPDKLTLKETIDIGDSLSEIELISDTDKFKDKNKKMTCFNGGGVYDHHIPSVVDFLSSKSEYYTAYTPYQAEVSQGTLQYLYEFQSMISMLSGLDVANASLYDGASALAEACSMSINISNKKKILISSTVNPNYIEVVKTYLSQRDIEIVMIDEKGGYSDIERIGALDDIASIVIQSPNCYGLIEDWNLWSKKIDKHCLLIAVSDPLSLAIIESPGECGADIYCGEGQSLGSYMNLGGPFLGLLASRMRYVRKMPGRIIGKTEDMTGREGYVLTLQAREQHIRRDKANSNICTNQSLIALRATIYMSLLGKYGLSYISKICFNQSQYAAKEVSKVAGFSIPYGFNFVKEFVVRTDKSVDKIISNAINEGISLSRAKNDNEILIAVTEKRTKKEIDNLVQFLKKQ